LEPVIALNATKSQHEFDLIERHRLADHVVIGRSQPVTEVTLDRPVEPSSLVPNPGHRFGSLLRRSTVPSGG